MHKPRRAEFLGLALIALLWAAPARAQDPNTDFAAYRALFSVATLGAARGVSTVTGFTLHYRGAMTHAAFALATTPDGRSTWRFFGGGSSTDTVRNTAQTVCDRDATTALGPGHTCRVLALDGSLPGQAVSGFHPVMLQIGPFRAAPLMFRHGPRAAEGVVLWSHGYGGPQMDQRQRSLPGILALLNDAGWDVMRFDRDPADDLLPSATATLRRGLPMLREAGYRRVVLAGQSRGGWQSVLIAAERPELVHAVLAFAPAAHGEAARPNNLAEGLGDFRRILAGLPNEGPRLAVAVFAEDPFDPDPGARAAAVADLAGQRQAPTLALFPEAPIRGHGGASDWRFTRALGPCIVSLVQAPAAAAPRGLRRNPCGGG